MVTAKHTTLSLSNRVSFSQFAQQLPYEKLKRQLRGLKKQYDTHEITVFMREEKAKSQLALSHHGPPRIFVISLPLYAKETVCDAQDFMNNGRVPEFKCLLSAVLKKMAAGKFTHNSKRTKILKTPAHTKVQKSSQNLAFTMLLVQGRISQNI